MGYSMMGGFLAPELKYAGYDKVIFRGKSPNLVYLWINNDKVEIRDASHLRGKGAVETAELIKQELKDPKIQVAAIGLAGENRVYMASIEQGRSSASRLGLGAVMGDKGLKAIAVRGTKDVNLARPAEFMQLCNEVLQYIKVRAPNLIPEVMPILAGLGSPQEMAHVDEKWHNRKFHVGKRPHPEKRVLDQGNRREVEGESGDRAEAAHQLLQLPMKCGAIISAPDFPPT